MQKSESRATMVYAGLLLAFCGRVLGQWLQTVTTIRWLPPFEAWQSGLLPYPVLLIFQMAIIAACLSFLWKIMTGRLKRLPGRGAWLRIAGWVYMAVAIARLVLGLTLIHGLAFFDHKVPATFHLVLAAMVMIWAGFHRRAKPSVPPSV